MRSMSRCLSYTYSYMRVYMWICRYISTYSHKGLCAQKFIQTCVRVCACDRLRAVEELDAERVIESRQSRDP